MNDEGNEYDDDDMSVGACPDNMKRNNKIELNFALTNARSLMPKLDSLVDYFDVHNLTFCMVTETWIQGCRESTKKIGDLLDGSHIDMIRRDRGKRGGGVAIAYDTRRAKLKKYAVQNNKYEIICATGKINNNSRKVAIICVYLPPKQTIQVTKEVENCLADCILKLKSELNDPMIIVGGDLNKKSINDAFKESQDIKMHNPIPTRGTAALDIVYSNLAAHEERSLPPLSNDNDVGSDHNVLLVHAEEMHIHKFEKIKIRHRKFTAQGREDFRRLITMETWDSMRQGDSTASAAALDELLVSFLDRCFPWKEFTVKSTDPPWMNNDIRRCAKKKRRAFRLEGRGPAYRRLQKEMDKLVKHAKGLFFEDLKKDLKAGGKTKGYHRTVKRFSTKEAPNPWDVREMLPDKTDDERCEVIAEYFNKISGEFVPLPAPHYSDVTGTPPEAYQIAARLKSMKKPKSQVQGDLPPDLATEYADILAIPLSHIYTQIYESLVWPELWKRETVTVIPKNSAPSSLSELRNLSCTPLFSKLLESYILDDLKEETSLSTDQYGGIKGSGPDHFLTMTWQEIMDNLDAEDGAAVSLISIDFAKAFNRMSHQACLSALAKHGAAPGTIALVSAFLFRRTMSVRVGKTYSIPKLINGGSPQGSILGNYLFCLTTDGLGDSPEQDDFDFPASIEVGTPAAVRRNRRIITYQEGVGLGSTRRERSHSEEWQDGVPGQGVGSMSDKLNPADGGRLQDFSTVDMMVGDRPEGGDLVGTVVSDDSIDGVDSDDEYEFRFFRFKNRLVFDSSDEEVETLQQDDIDYVLGRPENWSDKAIKKCIYIDDYNCIEKVRQRDGVYHLTTQGRTTMAHAAKSQSVFNNLKSEASKIGMVVNDKKTQLLCISPSINTCKTYLITDDGTRMESAGTLKLLGFIFDGTPTAGAQVDSMIAKFRRRLWSLRYLKKAGLPDSDVCGAYVTYLRPVLEYGSVPIHSILTKEQSDLIDKQQIRALKIVFGFDKTSSQVLTMSGLVHLSERRSKAFDRFALKLVENPRFQHLFPLLPPEQSRSRQSLKYLESHARTQRLYNSPIFQMRRRLNDMEHLKPCTGNGSGERPVQNGSQRCDFLYDEWR